MSAGRHGLHEISGAAMRISNDPFPSSSPESGFRFPTPFFSPELGREAVALDLQALQVFCQSHLEPQNLRRQVGVFEKPLALLRVPGSEERLQQAVEKAFSNKSWRGGNRGSCTGPTRRARYGSPSGRSPHEK
jgi:hypothetical protein